jgi:hypothetical protein
VSGGLKLGGKKSCDGLVHRLDVQG